MRLYVIRHGETDWNKERRAQGQTDVPLNEKGIRLAEVTAEALKDVPFDLCLTSPLIRAKKTAEIMIGNRDVPVIDEPRLMEISFGGAEGKVTKKGVSEVPYELVSCFHLDPMNFPGFEGGETVKDVLKRAGEVMDELIADPKLQDKTILVSIHGCVMRAFLNRFYDDPQDFWQHKVPDNCAVNILDIKDGKAKFLAKDKVYYDSKLAVNYFEWDDVDEDK